MDYHSSFISAGLINTFSGYGPLTVEWPGKDGKHPRCPPKGNVAKGNNKLVGKTFFFPLQGGTVVSKWHAGEFGCWFLGLLWMVMLGLTCSIKHGGRCKV